MSVSVAIWPGSSSFTTGSTPYQFYDTDTAFQTEADQIATWITRRLGYPIMDIELQASNIYTCFEEAVTEYGNQVNIYNTRDNLINVQGISTGSALTGRLVSPILDGIFKIADEYGTEVGAGGNVTLYTGSINATEGNQVYDLTNSASVTLETGSVGADVFSIRRIFHDSTPAVTRFLDPQYGGLGAQSMMAGFGWGGYSPGVSYTMMPLYADVLQLQAIEMNDQIRKSHYGFQLTNTRLRIFPVPSDDFKIHFHYYLRSDQKNVFRAGAGVVSDASNIPYGNLTYSRINSTGKQWIRKYTLALCKELLGLIRGKYSSIPIPNSEVTLNAADLLTQASTEKEALITELKDTLDQLSRQSQLERKQAEAESLQVQLNKVPLFIYVG